MLPIAQLTAFSQHFKHILFTTTIHSYEGTGRCFELKFKQKINRTFSDFELIEPLRWSKDDALEAFIDELLLLNVEDEFKQTVYDKSKFCQITERSQEEILSSLSQFYGLMTLAHYRTSPLDLRRLFDANSQCFFTAENDPLPWILTLRMYSFHSSSEWITSTFWIKQSHWTIYTFILLKKFSFSLKIP